MATKKLSKSHTAARKKRSAMATSSRLKKAAATKARKSGSKAKPFKPRKETPEEAKERIELTLRAFRMAYESNQRGTFRRL